MAELKVPPESGNSTEDGDMLAETEGLERDRNDKGGMGCMGGVTQGAGAVWVGEFAWISRS
jgi:hypothetical protein